MKWLLIFLLAAMPLVGESKEPISHYQVHFSPSDHLADELISLIDKERKSIKAAVYCLTHRGIVKSLKNAHERGVLIEVIVDPYSLKPKSVLRSTDQFPFPILVWNPTAQYKRLSNGKSIKRKQPLMHDKFCVFGADRVWTGSFNFTQQASLNQENVLVVQSSELASAYVSEFERIKKANCISLETYLKNLK